ncbi:iron-sulfur cluster biosynthesis family protein [Acetilactobacillus jinshanensis]|uniref:Iron-sulfur cluster biosynthesis family protein n=1 Tax=Acetilactobacillus jinshanensis TaxID=1720083 RepID=A0A4P6ZIZ7_9LACO|nr:iron-sulfur cluster biosynthesis family protein [Acetilactobacillus jinshanensis]QBP17685.1 iron-sulfur cluster biosynthesis family protein [Acetilactobacillus jinshanensis]URL61771.1 iron-sulfur cluster biosynthesis family protein [uncultured bacterium]
MDKITISDAVKKRIEDKIKGPAKLLLSYNDGVGPYSKVGSCSIGTAFDIIAVKPDEKTPDYGGKLDSDLGTFYYKPYSARYLDKGLKLDVGSFNQINLSGEGGVIDGSVNIIDDRNN